MASTFCHRRLLRLTAVVAVVVSSALALSSVAHGYSDRIERRAGELALPDDVLDPSWPTLAPGFEPGGVAPSLEGGDDDGMYLDEAEREELERYLVERGIIPDPNVVLTPSPLGRDDQLGAAPEGTIGEEYSDPADW